MSQAIIPTTATEGKKFLKFLLWVAISLLILFLIYILIVYRSISISKIKSLVSSESKKYSDPVAVEKLLMQGVYEILRSPALLKQARIFSKATNIAIEQVVVDNAISLAKDLKYI